MPKTLQKYFDQKLNPLEEFSALMILLTLVTAINSSGRQVLQSDISKAPEMPTTLEKSQSILGLAQNALATLLVRGTEIIAVTAATSVELRSADPSHPAEIADTLDLLAVQDSSRQDDIDISDPKFNLDFTALPNVIDSLSPFVDINPDAQYTLFKEGKSYWPDVEKNPWCKVVPL